MYSDTRTPRYATNIYPQGLSADNEFLGPPNQLSVLKLSQAPTLAYVSFCGSFHAIQLP